MIKNNYSFVSLFCIFQVLSCSSSNTPPTKSNSPTHKEIKNTTTGNIGNTTPSNHTPSNQKSPVNEIKEQKEPTNPGKSQGSTNEDISQSSNNSTTPSENQLSQEEAKTPKKKKRKNETYGEIVQNKICYQTGKRTNKVFNIHFRRYSPAFDDWKNYTTYKYRKYEVKHNGNCGVISTIPVLLLATEQQLMNMLDLMENELHLSLTDEQKETLTKDEYYIKLKFTDDYPSLIQETKETIRKIKSSPPRPLDDKEKKTLIKFIKHSILIIRFTQGRLNEEFWKGADGHREYICPSLSGSVKSSGSPNSWGKDWWVDQMDISAIIGYLTTGINQEETSKTFGGIFYKEPQGPPEQINVRSNQISQGKYKPPYIYIIYTSGMYNYMVLDG